MIIRNEALWWLTRLLSFHGASGWEILSVLGLCSSGSMKS